ncbi:MAG: CBS domain-containing protein [Candidatus Thiodiazotropha sp.]
MTPDVLYGYEDDDTTSAVTTMEHGQVRRLLVLDHDQHCVGVLSLGDIALRGKDPKLSEELLERVSEPPA